MQLNIIGYFISIREVGDRNDSPCRDDYQGFMIIFVTIYCDNFH